MPDPDPSPSAEPLFGSPDFTMFGRGGGGWRADVRLFLATWAGGFVFFLALIA